jgi:hypothetical protein
MLCMRRRQFITLLGAAAAVWPLAARAQQSGAMRRIGMLHTPAADDPEGQARNAAFLQGLAQFGWTHGDTCAGFDQTRPMADFSNCGCDRGGP